MILIVFDWKSHWELKFLLALCYCVNQLSGWKLFSPGVRSYRNYVVDPNTGYLRRITPVSADVKPLENLPTPEPSNQTRGGTLLVAVPYSLDQMVRANGHSLLDRSWDVHEVPPVVHVHMIWPGETSRPVSLPCWAPAQLVRIRLNETTFRSHRRTWYIGQGNTLSLSMATSFGYKTDPSSGALQVTPFMGLRYGHSVFTCALSRETAGPKPKVSFAQLHMIYYQTTDPDLVTVKNKARVTVDLTFKAYAFDSDSPACNHHHRHEGKTVCAESAWMNIHPVEQNITTLGYRLYNPPKLNLDQIPGLLHLINETIRDFCRIYSCVIQAGPHMSPFLKPKAKQDKNDKKRVEAQEQNQPQQSQPTEPIQNSEDAEKLKKLEGEPTESEELTNAEQQPKTQNKQQTVTGFYGDWIVLEGQVPRRKSPELIPHWESDDTRVTHNLPGNEVLNLTVSVQFTNEMVDCNMVHHLIEPDMGDLQQTAHYFTLENEPAAPLTTMLEPFEMTWLRTRERTDAEKYLPTMCLSQGNFDRASFGDFSFDAILPYAGYTAVFVVPKVDNSDTSVAFTFDEGTCELQVLCKNGRCKVSFSLEHAPLFELPIHNIPRGGIHEIVNRTINTGDNTFILVAHPVHGVEGNYKQFVSVYRNMHRVTDGEVTIKTGFFNRRCGGNTTTVHMATGSMIKLLNWPEYELSGPSLTRSTVAYHHLVKPCNESYDGIPYSSSTEPMPSPVHSNNNRRLYYSLEGLPCSGDCKAFGDTAETAELFCHTIRKKRPCTKEFYTPISRELYDITRNCSSPLYAALALQYCNSEYMRIEELSAQEIASREALACNISGNLQSLSQVLVCAQELPVSKLREKLDSNLCSFANRDDNYQHLLSLDSVKLKLKPVIQRCTPHPDVAPLYKSYIRDDFRVYMRTHGQRKCPIGYRKAKSVDNYTCTRCPADSYADMDTEPNTCKACPMTRPSTFFADGAGVTQCSNEQLNRIRGMFFRYNVTDNSDDEWENKFVFRTPQWWNGSYNKFENLEHLRPNESYLRAQQQAIDALFAMTQMLFSDGEIFLLLVISTALAVYGGVLFMLLMAAVSIPRPCPAMDQYGSHLSMKERLGIAIFCQVAKIAMILPSLWKRMTTRVRQETKRMRQSMVSQRLSRITSSAGKRVSSVVRSWYKSRLPPLTDRQKALIRLISETTINRIVEAAVRDLTERRQRLEVTREEQRRQRQKVGEIEAEAATVEAMAAVAQREAKAAELRVADAKDAKSRLIALQAADEAKQHADSLMLRASEMRSMAKQRLTEILFSNLYEEIIPIHKRRFSAEDEHAVQNAAPELRAFLRLPRHHTPAYFLFHPDVHQDELLRSTAFPAPERDWKRA